jgi:PEP-CTERM motif-containing protein
LTGYRPVFRLLRHITRALKFRLTGWKSEGIFVRRGNDFGSFRTANLALTGTGFLREKSMKRFSVLAAAGIGLAMLASGANAQYTPIANFDAPYPPIGQVGPNGAWADSAPQTVITSNPTNWEVASTAGYGSNFFNIYFANYGPVVNISNDNTLLLTVNIVAGVVQGGDFFVDLTDGDSGGAEGFQYNISGNPILGPGQYTFTIPLDDPTAPFGSYGAESAEPGNTAQLSANFGGLEFYLDTSQIIGYHLELDPGVLPGTSISSPYDVQYEALAAVPEPASIGIGAMGVMFLAGRRRRAVAKTA